MLNHFIYIIIHLKWDKHLVALFYEYSHAWILRISGVSPINLALIYCDMAYFHCCDITHG